MGAFRKKWFAGLIGMVVALAVVAGCGTSKPAEQKPAETKPAEQPKKEEPMVLRYYSTAEPPTLDPHLVTDSVSILVAQNIFNPLVQFNTKGEIVPAVAKSWKISDDGTVYTFTLHENAKFHNGKKVTAAEVKWSLERALAKETKSPVAMLYLDDIVGAAKLNKGEAKELEGVKVVNDTTLEIKIAGNRPYFLSKLTYLTSAPVPKEEIEKGGAKWTEKAVGTGPFKLKEWVHNSKIVLERNANYHLTVPKLTTVDLQIVKDAQTAWGMYQVGQLDMVSIPTADLKRTLADAKLKNEYLGWASASTGYLALNANVFAPFKDIRVRQAFNHAIDKNAFVNVALEGSVERADTVLPPTMPGYNSSLKSPQFDVAKAKQLMAAAGFPDGKGFPKLTITIRAQVATTKKMAEFIQAQLKTNLGIDVAIAEVEWAVMLREVRAKDKVPAFILSWGADYLDPENFINILFRSDSGNNRYGYKNAKVDELIKKGNNGLKWEQRVKDYNDAEKMILEDSPWVPLWHGKSHMLIKPNVKGLEYNSMGFLPFVNVTVGK